MDRERLRGRMQGAVEHGVFPGAVLHVARLGAAQALEIAVGRLDYQENSSPVTGETVFDLASLTKVIATTSLAMRAVASGLLDLDETVASVLEADDDLEWVGSLPGWLQQVRVRHLLAHCSGLPDWRPYFRMLEEADVPLGGAQAKAFVLERLIEEGSSEAPGTVARYSDVGFLLLGAMLETVYENDLRGAYRAEVAHPLDLSALDYLPVADGPLAGAAPTENCAWRGRVIAGEVGDENAWALGGVAPHAGLFGKAAEVARFGLAVLEAHVGRREDLFGRTTVRRFTTRTDEPAGSSWALGWDTPTVGASSAGKLVSSRAFGHLGFTGTSLWIDPQREAVVVLLTNRVHPTRENRAIREFRPAMHDAVWSWLDR